MARTNRPNIKSLTQQIESRDKKRKQPSPVPEELTLVPTPSTLFNCACSDTPSGGLAIGRMVNLIGDSSSGKSIFALSIFAEMAQHEVFNHYRFVYDDVENANSFDMERLFGAETADRIEPPAVDEEGDDCPSDTIEDFHCNISDCIDHGVPFVYVLDSFDALDSDQDREKLDKMRKARASGRKESGSYGMSKAKKSSEILRNIVGALKRSEGVLIIISQTRDNIDPISFEKKNRSGGWALKFYANHEIWLAMAGKIPKKDRVIGNKVKAKITKNKLTGKVREIEFPIFYDYGVDDIRSCVEWMVKESYWSKKKLTIDASDLHITGTADKVIRQIEDRNLERKLKRAVGKAWVDIEETLKLNRKPKYK